jgi:hypothetical protein
MMFVLSSSGEAATGKKQQWLIQLLPMGSLGAFLRTSGVKINP